MRSGAERPHFFIWRNAESGNLRARAPYLFDVCEKWKQKLNLRLERNDDTAVTNDVIAVLRRHGIRVENDEPVLLVIAPKAREPLKWSTPRIEEISWDEYHSGIV
jgi:hypothetical protein